MEKESYLHVLSRYINLNPVSTKQKEDASLTEKKRYLKSYPWSSLLGYIDDTKKESFVDYAQILETYGGDTSEGRKSYWKAICNNLSAGIDIKENVIGGSILGSGAFIDWVREKFLPSKSREMPAVKQLKRHNTKEEVIEVLCKEVDKGFDEIKKERGITRQIAMDVLYRFGGLTGKEIGEMMGVDYSTVSQGRKRLRETLKRDKGLLKIMERIEVNLSR